MALTSHTPEVPLVGARFLGRESPRSTSAGTSATGTSRPWLISGQLLAEDRAYEVTEGPGAGGGLPRQRRSRPGPGNGPFGSRGGAKAGGQISTRRSVASHFFLPSGGADPAPSIAVRTILATHLGHGGHFRPPPCRGAGNVRAGTGPGPRFGHRVPKSGPTGWAIPPDPQQARGGEIPVQGGP